MTIVNFSIVIPCYNEEKNITLIVERVKPLLVRKDIELILVDNGSTDTTRSQIKHYTQQYPVIKLCTVKKNIGYGFGILSGLRVARGTFVGWTHADLQTDPMDTLKALAILQQQPLPETIFVKGRRYGRPLFDKFFTWGMNIFETLILRTFLYEINAQPNVFHRSFLTLLKQPPNDFSFDLYTYYLAKKNNYTLKRFPVYFGKRIYGESKWNTGLKAKFKFIKRTLKFSFQLKKLLKHQ